MQPQAVHDAEVHRQHVRLKVPIQVEIDGVRYQVDDWSVGGFGVESVMISREPRERFPVRLIFPFEEFEMSLRLDARMVYANQDHGRFGCAFVGCSREQVAVLRYLAGAYLSGEVVSAGDILRIRPSERAGEVRPERDPGPAPGLPARRGRLRRVARPAGLGLALGLLAVAALGIRELPLGSTAYTGVVEAPLSLLRAPAAGRFEARLAAGEAAAPGALVGTIRPPGGEALPLESPCRCAVLETLARNGETRRAGEPLMALIEADEPLMIRTQTALEEVGRLGPGKRVEIRTLEGARGVSFGQIAGIELRPGLEALRRAAAGLPPLAPRAQVLIRPDRPLPLGDFGRLVAVRFL